MVSFWERTYLMLAAATNSRNCATLQERVWMRRHVLAARLKSKDPTEIGSAVATLLQLGSN